MKIDEHIKYWLNSADHDLDAAESLFAAGKFDWCLFKGTVQMDQIPAKIRRIINQYIKESGKNKIHIQRAVMFGSHSKGLSHEWSDIDIALVSDAFDGVRMRDRYKIRRITLSISSDLSPFPFISF